MPSKEAIHSRAAVRTIVVFLTILTACNGFAQKSAKSSASPNGLAEAQRDVDELKQSLQAKGPEELIASFISARETAYGGYDYYYGWMANRAIADALKARGGAAATALRSNLKNEQRIAEAINGPGATVGMICKELLPHALIAKLRSPNKDPNPRSQPWVDYPKSYDHRAQEQVNEAVKQLEELGPVAFPVLIEHSEDLGYSRSTDASVLLSRSIGAVCQAIIEDQIQIASVDYKTRPGADKQHYPKPNFFSTYYQATGTSKAALTAWWREHSDKTLKEMQLEALRWRIAEEQKVGFATLQDEQTYLSPLLQLEKKLQQDNLTKSNAK